MNKNDPPSSRIGRMTARTLARASRWERLLARAGTHVFTSETVTKLVPPDAIGVEVARTQMGHDLGNQSGLFHTPAIIRVDVPRSTLTSERVNGFVTLRDLLREDPQACIDLAYRVGLALGCIHRLFPRQFTARRSPLDNVHGDFNTMNVGLRPSDGAVVVLDWTVGRYFEDLQIRDPQLFEVAHFIYSIVAHHDAPWRVSLTLSELIVSFLDGYEAQSGRTINRDALRRELMSISRQLFLKIGSGPRLRLVAYVLIRLASHITLALVPLRASAWRRP